MKVLLVFIDMMRTDLLSVYNQNVKDKTSFDLLLEKLVDVYILIAIHQLLILHVV